MRALALLLLSGAAAIAQGDPEPFAVQPLTPDPARDARIADLIGKLPEIDKPWYGISDTSGGGVAFDAIDAEDIVPTALRELPRSGPPVGFRELVRLGPAAIPTLLKHLDDKRETKLAFHRREGHVGGMFEQPELFAGSSAERALIVRTLGAKGLENRPEEADDHDLGAPIRDHAVTVGDCCFAILGQIVNRPYEAVRYQPTLITIVSSPTRDPRMAEALRALWGRGDPRQVLAQSLHDDLWDRDSDGDRTGAVLRLSTYFPEEAGPALAKRIAEMRPGYSFPRPDTELLRAAMATGHPLVRAEWLKFFDATDREVTLAALKAAPSDPGDDAREKIRAILGQSTDIDILLACLHVLPDERSEGLVARLGKGLAAVQTRDRQRTRRILAALVAMDDERCLPLFRAHMERVRIAGSMNVLSALEENPQSRLAVALLPALLDATDPVLPGDVPRAEWERDGMRVCDWAACVVAKARPELRFDRDAAVEERDRQIAPMREALRK